MDLPTLISQSREAKGLSQRELAQTLGVSPGAVGHWETGKSKPAITRRGDLARILGISFIDLVPEAGRLKPTTISDPQVLLLVQSFQALPPPVREAILMQVAATAESLTGKPPASD